MNIFKHGETISYSGREFMFVEGAWAMMEDGEIMGVVSAEEAEAVEKINSLHVVYSGNGLFSSIFDECGYSTKEYAYQWWVDSCISEETSEGNSLVQPENGLGCDFWLTKIARKEFELIIL
jgi:hypothetical protein